jgi:hypothetical protein
MVHLTQSAVAVAKVEARVVVFAALPLGALSESSMIVEMRRAMEIPVIQLVDEITIVPTGSVRSHYR